MHTFSDTFSSNKFSFRLSFNGALKHSTPHLKYIILLLKSFEFNPLQFKFLWLHWLNVYWILIKRVTQNPYSSVLKSSHSPNKKGAKSRKRKTCSKLIKKYTKATRPRNITSLFLYPLKHQKTRDFLMLSGGTERETSRVRRVKVTGNQADQWCQINHSAEISFYWV